jgi:signal transduction histidine kinase
MNKNDLSIVAGTDTDWQTQLSEKNASIQRLERELKIEAALERVRARAMAMQNSNELSALADTVFKELTKLDFALNWCMINIIEESTLSNTVWAANTDSNQAPESYHMKFEDYPFHDAMMKAYKERKSKYVYVIEGLEKKVYDKYLFNDTAFRKVPQQIQAASRAMEKYVTSFTFSNFGGLQTVGNEPLSDGNLDILERFGKVFDLTYTRFNDLLKAEAQSRESKIQLALERVRARTMAMQQSDELAETVSLLFNQLVDLGISRSQMRTCAIVTLKRDKPIGECWITKPDGSIIPQSFIVPYDETSAYRDIYAAWKQGEKFLVLHLSGDALIRHLEFLKKYARIPTQQFRATGDQPSETFTHAMFFSQGYLFVISNEALLSYHDVFKRIGTVFEQTYTRFLDLQKAEAQSRESNIQLALERVRAKTMAMQRSEELKDVIQVVYDQFVYLQINIEHTGFIIDYKERDDMHIWLADRHEIPTQVVIPYFDSQHWNSFIEAKEKGTTFFSNQLDFEEKNKFYKDLFGLIPGVPEETKEYYFSCPALAISTVLLENVGLYIENFSGTAYTEEENNTLMRFGRVFQQTYTRFNDLKIAEALSVQAKEDLIKLQTEKKRAEDALTELQAAQKQLIQSEKMASLGELTAGIAHEIQNPLNFVNNFSEVNQELISEMNDELGKGNLKDVLEIAAQIGENEKKITHHGKRADAIVKGMLLHSQSGTGKMDPTDMNALADEYLRLSYHGLRAKDSSFNATMQTDYDASVGYIHMVPQDMGRVLLNLYNNAFYAVSEKKKNRPGKYEPTVSVSTKKINDKAQIRIRDNGDGIPHKVLDKIFNPFFTTKPTGQGTGLGLSLSYDIVKAHGGEIKVLTKEGEFTEFLVQIPMI